MDTQQLREYCIGHYANCLKYLKMVLKDMTVEQLQKTHGQAKSGAELLFHAVATPHFWMKRAERPFEFRAKFETPEEAITLWERQLGVFKEILQDESELFYKSPTSIPWIMLRSSNHLIHHMSMVIYIRNILGMPAIEGLGDFNWGNLIDFHGDTFFG